MKIDRRGRLFVAGGPTGKAFVYDARTGEEIAAYQLVSGATFVNDVVVTRRGAYFTDSVNQVLYRIAIRRDGALAPSADTLPLTGDIDYDPAAFNANGIVAARDGDTLIVVQSGAGKLFAVEAGTGVTDEIELDETVTFGDGLLIDGRTLYVVRNQQNRIAVVKLDGRLRSGEVVRHIENDDFDVPTTIAKGKGALYAVNARFSTPPEPTTAYWLTRVEPREHGKRR
jgi:sugar lactone lactonase YvrE